MFQGRYKAVPVNDADGNMTTGPVTGAAGLTTGIHAPASATLKWDAENHLIQASVGGTTVDYAYDHLSRLIKRTQGGATTYYLYDGWNRIAEYSGTTLSKVYTWGLGLSGSPQGAGGVGGLLSILDISSGFRYYPSYDGNGNVSEYYKYILDSDPTTSGNQTVSDVAAHFEYDPFGNLTADTGGHAADFPFRFSSKPQDPLTGLLYYGYRWYDPLTGRWPSRDPIGERGGVNLYGFVGNATLAAIDLLGLDRKTMEFNILDLAGDFAEHPDSFANEIDFNPNAQQVFSIDDINRILTRQIDPYSSFGKPPCHCVEKLIIWTHGTAQGVRFGPGLDVLSNGAFFPGVAPPRLIEKLKNLASFMCDTGEVYILACNIGENDAVVKGLGDIFTGMKVNTYKCKVSPKKGAGGPIDDRIIKSRF